MVSNTKKYMNNYYNNNKIKWKNKGIYICVICDKNVDLLHKSRHDKTNKHIINMLSQENINLKENNK